MDLKSGEIYFIREQVGGEYTEFTKIGKVAEKPGRSSLDRAKEHQTREDKNFAGRFQDHTGRVVPSSNLWYALSALYFSLQHLSVGSSGRIGNYDQYKEENLVVRGTQFLEMLWNSRPEYKSVANTPSSPRSVRLPRGLAAAP